MPVGDYRGERRRVRRSASPWLTVIRESTASWREVLLDLKARGLQAGPLLAVGDGAMGFWAALEEVFPATRAQRCWFHKLGNVLNALPASQQARAKAAMQDDLDGSHPRRCYWPRSRSS